MADHKKRPYTEAHTEMVDLPAGLIPFREMHYNAVRIKAYALHLCKALRNLPLLR